MSLEVAIEKNLPGFRLAVEFTADGAPLGLLGPSGSGKTMTLRAIAGLETPDRGRIVLHGRVLFDSEKRINVPARERRIGLLFQSYALFPHLTVAENIAFGLRHLTAPERDRRVEQQLAAAHLDGLASRFPATLSGGEQQRVALARALAVRARGPVARRTIFRARYALARRARTATSRHAGQLSGIDACLSATISRRPTAFAENLSCWTAEAWRREARKKKSSATRQRSKSRA